MQWLITGASGFLGSRLAQVLSARGDAVRCLLRPGSDRAVLEGTPVEVVIGDITDKASLAAAVAGVDAIVHCAATTSETSPDLDASRRTNVAGTQNLLETAAEQGVVRFIFISSQSAMPDNTGAYGMTKLEAERCVATSGLAFTTLRPSTIYGPGGRGLFAKIARFVERLPVVPIIGSGRQRFRPIHVDDVAAAVVACVATERTIGQTYDIGGLDGISFAELIDGIGVLLERRPVMLRIPIPVCIALARVLAMVTDNPPLTMDNIVGVRQMRECDIAAAQRDFGFRPRAFRDAIAAMRHERQAAAASGREEERAA